MDNIETKEHDITISSKKNNDEINTFTVKKKLQILYIYANKLNKSYKEIIEECAEWDKDCRYALDNPTIHNLCKYI